MNPDLITAAVLFGPATLLGGAAAIAELRDRAHHRAFAALLTYSRSLAPSPGPDDDPDPTPPDGGQPAPNDRAAVVRLAPVIPLPTRHPTPAARRTA